MRHAACHGCRSTTMSDGPPWTWAPAVAEPNGCYVLRLAGVELMMISCAPELPLPTAHLDRICDALNAVSER